MRLLCEFCQKNVPTTLVTTNVLNATLYKLLEILKVNLKDTNTVMFVRSEDEP